MQGIFLASEIPKDQIKLAMSEVFFGLDVNRTGILLDTFFVVDGTIKCEGRGRGQQRVLIPTMF